MTNRRVKSLIRMASIAAAPLVALLLLAACGHQQVAPPPDLGDRAFLQVTKVPFNPFVDATYFEFSARLFAIDGKRIIRRRSVVLEPGEHEVEFVLWGGFGGGDKGVRILHFDAKPGKQYELVARDLNGDPDGEEDDVAEYFIRDSGNGEVVASGKDDSWRWTEHDQRTWFIDEWGMGFGGVGEEGTAILDVGPRYPSPVVVTIAGAEEKPKFPYSKDLMGSPPHTDRHSVQAGSWVVEVFHRGYKSVADYYGRAVVYFRPGAHYRLESKNPLVGHFDAWIVDVDSGENVARFHACRRDVMAFTFSQCEEAGGNVEYHGIEPGDPRFWWD